jgi:hypothetical protein
MLLKLGYGISKEGCGCDPGLLLADGVSFLLLADEITKLGRP